MCRQPTQASGAHNGLRRPGAGKDQGICSLFGDAAAPVDPASLGGALRGEAASAYESGRPCAGAVPAGPAAALPALAQAPV